jgi:CMP-N-acetylneuraminic acid synthetase/spore coat polysaccharide biosynthesis predicted glycosyltransferase SpsG
MEPKIIAIIPARGGSKGIPRKNIRLLAGKPLIAYTIEAASKSKYIDRAIVSTEDEEIAEISKLHSAEVIKRPNELGEDNVTLDPVIFHAVNSIEKKEDIKYDFVLTIQPTSPLLTTETLNKTIEIMLNGDYDTLISVKDETHLYWTKKDGGFIPIYKERKNRQNLDPIYKETGAILISKRESIIEDNRIGDKIFLFEIPKEESIDIDTYQDWWIAENLLKKQTIVFRVDGDNEIGLGHIYRMITLASRMVFNHNIIFLMDYTKRLGIEKVKEYNYPIITFEGENALFRNLEKINPDIVINDILDTSKEYILKLKNGGYFVVNFEDLGDGSEFADLVINALYENSYPPENHYYGYKYVCLRDDFFIFSKKEIQKEVKEILITFGGADPNNLTMRTLKSVEKLNLKDIFIKVVLGLGYSSREELNNYVNALKKEGFTVDVKENVKMMAKEMYNVDIVITSNGRTIYEVASIGTPCISISQNEREVRHLFVHNSRGVMDLGIAYNVSEDNIASAIRELIENYELRKEMNKKFLKFDLKGGINRVFRLIFDEYYRWKGNERMDK